MALQDHPLTDVSGEITDNSSHAFNGAAHVDAPLVPIPDIAEEITSLEIDFQRKRGAMTAEELRNFHVRMGQHIKSITALQGQVQSSLLPFNISQTDEWLRTLDGAAEIIPTLPRSLGQKFIEARDAGGVSRVIDLTLSGQGSYSAYQLGGPGSNLIKQVRLHTMKETVDNDANFMGSDVHENVHNLSLINSRAMKMTPWRKDTNIVAHPLAWMRAERLAEKVAYTGGGLFYGLTALAHPDIRETLITLTKDHSVSVQDFLDKISVTSTFQELATELCLTSLDKPLKRQNHFGRTDGDRNYLNAIVSFWDGLAARIKAGDTNFEYVDFDPADYYQIGELGIGVNFLGETELDERHLAWAPLRDDEQDYLNEVCQRYNIPALSECKKLREYDQVDEPQTKATANTAAASIIHSSGVVHSPQYS